MKSELINLLSFFDYSRELGILIWKNHWCRSKGKFINKIAGSLKTSHNVVYRRVMFKGKNYYIHNLIWLIETGKYPTGHIDHIDGNGLNNHISNLREVTLRQNHQNRKRHREGKLVGVHKRKDTGKFTAKIYKNGKEYWLGCYSTEEKAHQVYVKELKEHYSKGGI